MTTGKTTPLTRWTFVDKVMSLLLNMLSRLVTTFLPRRKCLLISWLQSPSAVIFGDQKNKVLHCFYCFPIYFPWSDGTRCHDLSFRLIQSKSEALSHLVNFHIHALVSWARSSHPPPVQCVLVPTAGWETDNTGSGSAWEVSWSVFLVFWFSRDARWGSEGSCHLQKGSLGLCHIFSLPDSD